METNYNDIYACTSPNYQYLYSFQKRLKKTKTGNTMSFKLVMMR